MDTYEEVISTFMHTSLPALKVNESIHFESVVGEVFGSKQRRQGPMPSPEVQVVIRDYVRNNKVLNFFIPWSGSKIREGSKLDVLEFMAIKHLACLKESLLRLGVESQFYFRLEDTTDFFLCPGREEEVKQYTHTMFHLTAKVLGGQGRIESDFAPKFDIVKSLADECASAFEKYLRGEVGVEVLQRMSWAGEIPQEQRDYYYTAYKEFYPDQDHVRLLAEYFAITLARKVMHFDCLPDDPTIQISFTRPVPGTPMGRNRLYYRTIPERYTCKHRAPWVGDGYFLIDDETNTCCPKYIDRDTDMSRLVDSTLNFNGIEIHAPYMLK